ncbi:MAG TPA: Ig-like domain-containing protein [Oscillospiraceae bacterium]|nr:Ig-like domain-containing protein [Oscillospiraceae bacterium]
MDKKNALSKAWGKIIDSIKRKPIIWCSAAVCVIALCIASVIFIPKIFTLNQEPAVISTDAENQSDLRELPKDCLITSVEAKKTAGRLIEPDSEFKITSSKDMKADKLKSMLLLNSGEDFELKRTASCSYTLKSKKTFPMASIVKLSLHDNDGGTAFSWAFQTSDVFRITSTLPEDKSEYVPVDSGIEINFSVLVDIKNAEKYFEISPLASGTFKQYRSTLVFVPTNPLNTDTVYTVTFKEGFKSADGAVLSKGTSFKFKTQHSDNYIYCYTSNENSETFLPGEQPLIEIYNSSEMNSNDFGVTLYRYENADDYYNALNDYAQNSEWNETYVFPTKGLTSVYESTDKLTIPPDIGQGWRPSYLFLPDNLEVGWYLADIRARYDYKDFHIQRNIQINPISVYANVLPSQAAFFINDTATGETAADASISLNIEDKKFEAKTDEKGTAFMNISAEEDGYGVLKVNYSGNTYIDVLDHGSSETRSSCEDYFMYMYTDREAYLSTDTVKIWGLIRPRSSKSSGIPSNLDIKFGYEDTEGERFPIDIQPDGTFTATVSYKNRLENWGNQIALMNGDTEMYSRYITICDYVKPTYVIDAKVPYYAWMPQKNPVDVNVNASFYEGTPAAGLTFNVNENTDVASSKPSQISTDTNGFAKTSLLMKDQNTWRPSWNYFYLNMSGIENEYQTIYGNFYSIFRDVMLESEFTKSDKTGALKIKTSTVNREILNEKQGYYESELNEKMRGEPIDTKVNATLRRVWYEKRETGSYYDFLQKKTVYEYEYDNREETLGTFSVNTINGVGEFSNIPMNDPESSYFMDLSWTDTLGQPVQETVTLCDESYYYYRSIEYHDYSFSPDSETFTEGQTLNFKLLDNYDEVTDNKGRIFYTVSGSEFITSDVVNSPEFSHTMTADYIPNINFSGAYFDGKHVYPIYERYWSYRFDPSDRAIDLTVTSDKNKYSPGEKASVTVKAVDKNGKPVRNAAVSLSVVDEAAFAIMDQTVDPLKELYSSIDFPQSKPYYSYVQHILGDLSAGERGGGGEGTAPRRDFKDTAAFVTGMTDSDGMVSLSFSLPDNLTTWRATVQAISENGVGNIYAGTAKKPIIVTRPLFISPIVMPKYTEGDDITFSAMCNGEAKNVNEITATVTKNGVDNILTAKPGEPFKFGRLPKGEYKVLFSAKNGQYSDAVELPFEVVDTVLETPVLKTFDLTGSSIPVSPTRWPVNLTFYNKDYLLYGKILNKLGSSWGERLDFQIAQGFVAKEYGYITEEQFVNSFSDITSNGTAKLLPYMEDDYELTALICVASPELVDKSAVSSAFYQKLSDRTASKEDVISCYLGLAALSEPVLPEILELLESQDDFNWVATNRMRLCAALALLGDYQNALKYYTELTESITIDNNSTNNEMKAYISYNGGDVEYSTRLTFLTASILNLKESEAMARYLTESEQTYESCALEFITYLRRYVPKSSGSAEFEYNLNGKTEKIKLDNFRGHTIRFGEEQLKKADFKVTSGNVSCTAYYTGLITEQDTEPSIIIEKTYTSESGSWKPGDLIRVDIKLLDNNMSYYKVEDVIPSCARYAYSAEDYYIERNGQHIKASFYKSNTVSYYIRLVTPGEYVMENAVVRDYKGNWGKSERGKITVEEND